MAWHIDKVRPRVEFSKGRPRVVRYEWGLVLSSYGGAWGTARTRKQAANALRRVQSEMFSGQF